MLAFLASELKTTDSRDRLNDFLLPSIDKLMCVFLHQILSHEGSVHLRFDVGVSIPRQSEDDALIGLTMLHTAIFEAV